MIRHIVAFDLVAEDATARAETVSTIRGQLEPLAGVIPGVLSLELGDDIGGIPTHWPLVLVTEHPDLESLQAYQAHPAHQAAIAAIDPLVRTRAVVDYARS
ncbi:Dabb family protein [Schumannella sp. 10F1B-5-1]|uniref:Dabb family protein n=1 Tax=Schumannella sp. 10F1B-5-1 TaxID=2590780 RepID=UPI0015E865FB|nr:Dabb family protein [Schumannella sp. 10F1B-5-1]